jgi:hypothetical protein
LIISGVSPITRRQSIVPAVQAFPSAIRSQSPLLHDNSLSFSLFFFFGIFFLLPRLLSLSTLHHLPHHGAAVGYTFFIGAATFSSSQSFSQISPFPFFLLLVGG